MSAHDDVVVEPCGNIVGNKSASFLRLPEVVESNLPGFPIAIDVCRMLVPNGLRKMLFGVLKRGQGCRRILFVQEAVLPYEAIAHIRIHIGGSRRVLRRHAAYGDY